MGEALRATVDRKPGTSAAAVQIVAAVVLILAATVMPWATYKDLTSGTTTSFRGGGPGIVLVVIGMASIVLSVASRNRPSITLTRLQLAVGCAAVIVCVVLALDKISAANNVNAVGPSETSWGFAPGVGFLAAATIAFTSLKQLRTS